MGLAINPGALLVVAGTREGVDAVVREERHWTPGGAGLVGIFRKRPLTRIAMMEMILGPSCPVFLGWSMGYFFGRGVRHGNDAHPGAPLLQADRGRRQCKLTITEA